MNNNPNILILCTGNSCRSQMAEGFFREYASDRLDVHSAGTSPASAVHPLAIQVMAEKHIDISKQYPKSVSDYLGKLAVRYLFIVCQDAEQNCPRIFPGMAQREFWPFDDPATQPDIDFFRTVRDQIELRVKQWLKDNQ